MNENKLKEQEYAKIFEEEFYPHADALYNFAYNLCYNEEDASDLVQETYMKAFRSIDKYLVGTNAKAWLFTILKNSFINLYRKKIKRPTKVNFEDVFSFQDEEDTNYSGYIDLRQEIYQNMMGDEVTNAVNTLAVDFRAVILLCDIEGFTYEEISKIINTPIGTVRSRLHRARNMLKEKLKTYAESRGFNDKRK